MAISLRRRTFLRGAGAAVLALPTLEAMLGPHGSTYASDGSELPCRYLMGFAHISIGAFGGPVHSLFAPDGEGSDYSFDGKVAIAPLEAVRDHVTLLSGLKIPTKKDNGNVLPAAGLGDTFHSDVIQAQFAGVATADGADPGPTADQLIAEQIGQDRPFGSLTYSASGFDNSHLVFTRRGDSAVKRPPITSPRQAWTELMGAYAPTDPSEAEGRLLMLEQRRSVLDLIMEDRARLLPQLGRADRRRLEQHFDQVRELEVRLGRLGGEPAQGCSALADPGDDPPVVNGDGSSGGATHRSSNEELRARTMLDLVHLAFSCDLSRVATLKFINALLWCEDLIGERRNAHDLTHNMGGDKAAALDRLSRLIGWMNGQLADFIVRLQETPEGDGNMLDRTVVVGCYEGGNGRGVESDGEGSHSGENMCAFVAGRAGGLVPGRHVAATGVHPGRVHVSAMQALGVTGGLGEIDEDEIIPELFGAG